MKKLVCAVFLLLILLFGYSVNATDTVYSYNKYSEENLNYILDADDDELVVAGTYKDKEDITQSFVIKYKSTGKIVWKYLNKKDALNEISGIINTYDDKHEKDGYLLFIKEVNQPVIFTKLDLEGNLVQEVISTLPVNTTIYKVQEVSDGFIIVGEKDSQAFIAKYDYSYNQLLINEYPEVNTAIIDVIYLNDSYYGIKKTTVNNNSTYRLLKYDIYLNEINTIKYDFEVNQDPQLLVTGNSYLVYGLSKEIKASKDIIGGYYLIKYNKQDEEEWETVGNSPADLDKIIQVQAIIDNNDLLKEYYVLSINSNDNSIEVVRIMPDGVVGEKIKKIKNSYYTINDYLFKNNILYFIGQINCPEDDNCDYNANSLLLVSTEDKVIEVKDNDSRNIIIGTIVFIVFVIGLYVIKKKHKLKKQ